MGKPSTAATISEGIAHFGAPIGSKVTSAICNSSQAMTA